MTLITLGHLSDLHATDPTGAGLGALLNKRFFGWLSWKLRRSKLYRQEVARTLFEDLARESPDHLAVTGDLTNISLPHEFEAAARMLAELGTPERVSLVPGNHDAYIRLPFARSWALWSDYLESDAAGPAVPEPASAQSANMFSFPGVLPSVRIRGDLALVGIFTAVPTGLFRATGTVGRAQLEQLESTLVALRARDLCRVVLVHHPPLDTQVSSRRRLLDSAPLRRVLERAGAELVLHGHNHRSQINSLAGAEAAIPVVGVRSASYAGPDPEKAAQYHIYEIERAPAGAPCRFRVSLRTRGWDSGTRRFGELGAPRRLSG